MSQPRINTAALKELRERTGAGMSDCKNALIEAEGDIDKAVEIILKKGIVKAASRAGRIAAEGQVSAFVSQDHKRGVLLEVNCQTDFVARSPAFVEFVQKVVDIAGRLNLQDDLESQPWGDGKVLADARQKMIADTGENVVIRRWHSFRTEAAGGYIYAYVHGGGRIGVLLHVEAPSPEAATHEEFLSFADHVAMQIASMNPLAIDQDGIDLKSIYKQREIFLEQIKTEVQDEDKWPKVVQGKMTKWLAEMSLLSQDSIIKSSQTVRQVKEKLEKNLDGPVTIHQFLRYELGEGIERKADDFVEEVAKLI
ncbi:translation elongation factor Ts [Pajaroellobacter abortibovis]|uniref:Elongation factor Ts n=1 Tax=Pajaroellobacter abortibovis TaxID=1882918 RepID=A0A1L6MY54_9BACT|nr:translation elongation factor Ts [Pajaroellobacter abortibovis]APS00387.1 translation elongation factor Ts [Pajaroellobacter abortibovis]